MNSGTVGGPSVCNEFKLIDVPEMKYTSKDICPITNKP
jgi:long-chain acyl-CoA synthetase